MSGAGSAGSSVAARRCCRDGCSVAAAGFSFLAAAVSSSTGAAVASATGVSVASAGMSLKSHCGLLADGARWWLHRRVCPSSAAFVWSRCGRLIGGYFAGGLHDGTRLCRSFVVGASSRFLAMEATASAAMASPASPPRCRRPQSAVGPHPAPHFGHAGIVRRCARHRRRAQSVLAAESAG